MNSPYAVLDAIRRPLPQALSEALKQLFAERFSILRQWLTEHPKTFKVIQSGIFALLGAYVLWP